MKTTKFWLTILAIGLLAPAGCKKADESSGPVTELHGVKLDQAKLDAEFASASQEVQDRLASVKRFFRYGQLPQALVELDQLSKQPNLTEPQKKLVNDLLEQTKQALTKAPAPPGQ